MNLKKLNKDVFAELFNESTEARAAILKMTTLANSGHPGGSMSTIDVLLTLYKMIDVDCQNPEKENRDMVVVSHGHVSPAVYSTLALNGFFSLDAAISQYRLANSIFEGHIEPDVPGIEWATGNLGQGLSAGIGFALARRLKKINNRIYVLMGDGEQQKGQLSEARRFAVKYKLSNITAIIDYNRLQISGTTEQVMPQNIKENYSSDGWHVLEINGHDFEQIHYALNEADNIDKPVVIIAHTVMGKGVSFMENKEKYHGSAITEEQLQLALKELGKENNIDYFKKLRRNFKVETKLQKRKSNFNLDTGKHISYDKPAGNRDAWGKTLSDIAFINKESNPLIAVFDCDLAGSVKTDSFAAILPDNFFQGGIMEHNTATIAGAMSKEGIQVFFADFGVFGVDETYNQHRLNDINETNLKLITTHVGLDVGEDGKTHQCIDYIGLIRNLYNFKIIIPSCPDQTDHIIRYIADKPGNYFVPMGRSKIKPITDEDGNNFYSNNYCYEYGKSDLLRDGSHATILTYGSVVTYALEAVRKLAEEGISVMLWNISSPTAINDVVLMKAAETGIIFTYEDHNVNTGLGSLVADRFMELRIFPRLVKLGVKKYAISGVAEDVFSSMQLDTESLISNIREAVRSK